MDPNPNQESLQRSANALRRVDTRLRNLDVDDLYLLSFLGDGKRLADAARTLSLSQPAITQRVHKIEQSLNIDVLERGLRGTRLTEAGLVICRRASEVISLLERFFDGTPRNEHTVAVTGAWAAWIMAAALTRLPEEHIHVDVEFINAETMRSASRSLEGFGEVVVTLHRHSSSLLIPGFSTFACVTRPIALWSTGCSKVGIDKPVPLIEVSRDDALLDSMQRQMIEEQCPMIRGVRYAGTVAGAVKMAAKGHGVLIAPQGDAELGLGLVKVYPEIKLGKIDFDLLVDDRAPVGDLLEQLGAALK